MQITKLKIFGFKSFAQRTEVNFPTKGLTAVVGPNGCGKSNITDAIRWVLGEQKAAALRMGKMQDVIFSGTEERAAMSLAEVSIVIDNSDGTLNSEYSEVIVTRRVHRDGTGEYLINNQECRLRDVHALLFDSGLGSSTYSQMNADMIKAVLSDKADDRRVLFEEAAGVSKYKQQRKETRRQLERVQMDMDRVEDNLRSVRRSVRQYETQAEKVNEYKRLSKRLRELDLSVSIDKFEDMKEGLGTLETTTKRMNHEVETAKTNATVLQTKIDEKKLLISEDETAYRDLERAVQTATIELNDLDNRIMRIRDVISTLENANDKAQDEINQNQTKIQDLTDEQGRLEEENRVLSSDSDMDEMNALLERERETLQVMRDKLDDLRQQSRELSNERLQATQKANALKSRFERMDAESSILQGNLEKWNGELATLNGQKSEANEKLQDIQRQVDEANQDVERLNEQKSTREERLDSERADLAEAQKKLQDLTNEKTRLQSRIDVLQSVANEGTDASRWLVENKAELIGGLLSERIEAAAEYASYVEAALGDLMDAVIVANDSAVIDIVNSMKGYNVGQALLALVGDSAPAYNGSVDGAGVVGCLNKFVTADAEIASWLSGILSRYFVVENLDVAISLAKSMRDQDLCFVCPDAIVRTSGLVSSGAATSGALSRKNEIADANALLENVLADIETQNEEIARIQDLVDEDVQMLDSLVDEIREKTDVVRGSSAQVSIQNNVIAGCDRRIGQLESEIRNAQAKIQEAADSKNSDVELNEANAAVERVEVDYARVNDELTEQDTIFREKEEDVRELERAAQDKNAKLTQNSSRLSNIHDQIEFLENSNRTRMGEIQTNSESIEKNRVDEQELAGQQQSKDSALRELENQRDLAREKYELVSGDLDDWQKEVNRLRDDMIEKMHELNDVDRRQQALQANLDRLVERITNEYTFDLSNPPDEFERVEYSQPEADREIRELRGRIKDLGPINVNVMEDYEDEKKRLEEVEKQFDDLDRARASLDRTITKLDDIARQRYLDTFNRIQKNFQFVFSKLFLNGETKMSLVEKVDEMGKPMDILDADIEINVRPTGKKMRGIKALSGGEHALTATALLFAIYMEKPSPYCVLDEVDGPLDDANVGRFMALLREFSKQTLFIVVTHNKRTMAEADMLYGVTQEIKGISRIASVQLADATKFAM
ncbi:MULTISPECIES: chromosome segregation protein SMC [unclassified Fibrobacter]|uniref:chromosome segregation protein SMC n=1 Tax=unclassified Fibrobacter TaxID=2634177 RepID=UPI000D6D50DD|nr:MULTISPECIES: chromosome segregation protein SMC [unclassified Fibrobacter]PWJ69952.1 condensin subunit Smc [Fibrobacter sp. UWR4]PZW73123.1 condensin subunit Smc [Fibrobacter sp. UWR1]